MREQATSVEEQLDGDYVHTHDSCRTDPTPLLDVFRHHLLHDFDIHKTRWLPLEMTSGEPPREETNPYPAKTGRSLLPSKIPFGAARGPQWEALPQTLQGIGMV